MSTITHITEQQENMITLLIMGENVTDIAKKIGVNRNTIYLWLERDYIQAELKHRRTEIAEKANQLILKDLGTYINNIKELAGDRTDKKVCLAANQFLVNCVYGDTSGTVEFASKRSNRNISEIELQDKLNKFKKISGID